MYYELGYDLYYIMERKYYVYIGLFFNNNAFLQYWLISKDGRLDYLS